MPITTDVRKYGETVLEQGKVVLDEARKPWFAAVGAGELAYGQLSQLPTEVQARLRKLQTEAVNLDPKDAVQTVTGKALGAYGQYATQAMETYESLAHRGELVVRRLRRSPEVRSAFDRAEEMVADAGELVADAGQTVAAAEEKVTKPGPAVTRKPATGKQGTGTTARTARKAPAKGTAKN